MTDFLNEQHGGKASGEDDFFAGTPAAQPPAQPQQAPAQPQRPQGQRFIPEGYEPPAALNERITRRRADMNRINARLARAGDQDPARNPYAKKKPDGKFDFDQFAYDSDKRAHDQALSDVNQLSAQLQGSMGVTERLSQSIESIARQVWQSSEARVPAAMKDAVRKRYAENAKHLMDIGHFQQPGYETRDALERSFVQVLTGIVGQFALDAAAQQAKPGGQASGGQEEKSDKPDEFEGWDPEAIKMYERGIGAGNRRHETLADKAKRDTEEAQRRLAAGFRGDDR